MFEQKKFSVRVLGKLSRGSGFRVRLSDGRAGAPPPRPTFPGLSTLERIPSGFPFESMPSAAPTARQNATEGKRSADDDGSSAPPPPETSMSTLARSGRSEVPSRSGRRGGAGAGYGGIGGGAVGDEGEDAFGTESTGGEDGGDVCVSPVASSGGSGASAAGAPRVSPPSSFEDAAAGAIANGGADARLGAEGSPGRAGVGVFSSSPVASVSASVGFS